MKAFNNHTGIPAPLKRSNVDTDQIIPAVFLKRITRTGFDDGLFKAWRDDPTFVLNQARYTGASILVVGSDFGTGSSREHAVWALLDYGFTVVVGSRFGPIFLNNAGKAGLVLAQLSETDVKVLWQAIEAAPGEQMSVDLVTQTIDFAGMSYHFEIDSYVRERLLAGLDDIGATLQHETTIATFETTRPKYLPVTVVQ
ncbi:MAG: 3-isopropylmalate dehydratase small subunit [Propionibacteriaceae bacterium]|jgi:3-isopropylmalate/(R)-2-methylmalate dehydratase small subunit|nr:3-isopropylmalate dehydratase small subunit [Propionibacteriaceae bacterium]